MEFGQILTIWTIRISVVLYVVAISLLLIDRNKNRTEVTRLVWTVACALYVIHVLFAFNFYHHWSHAEAYKHTAERTQAVVGLDWGGGIYFNYVFTLYWVRDVLLQWFHPETYPVRDRFLQITIHGLIAFIVFNATVVFASGPIRWVGIAGTVWLVGCAAWRANQLRKQSEA